MRRGGGTKYERFDVGLTATDQHPATRGAASSFAGSMKMCSPAPRVLVGETYLDASSGLLVRVLDSRRSTMRPTRSFVVESATRLRLGERWLCREEELLEVDAP